MDFTKNVVMLSLLALVLMPLASSEYTIDTFGKKIMPYDTAQLVGMGMKYTNATTAWIAFRSSNALEQHTLTFEIMPYFGQAPGDTTLTVFCNYGNSTDFNLSTIASWYLEGYAYVDVQTIHNDSSFLTLTPQDNATQESQYCALTANGQDLFITAYASPVAITESSKVIDKYDFKTPNTQLESVVGIDSNSGLRGLILSGFMILNLLIIITVVYFLVIIIVFTWKIFEYFVTRLRR